jgi:hypothetical protein
VFAVLSLFVVLALLSKAVAKILSHSYPLEIQKTWNPTSTPSTIFYLTAISHVKGLRTQPQGLRAGLPAFPSNSME